MRISLVGSVAHQVSDALTRRTSLLTLSGAALAAGVTNASVSKAKKKGKNCKKTETQRCASDTAACRTAVLAVCGTEPEKCEPQAACCDACSGNGFLDCLIELQGNMVTARLS